MALLIAYSLVSFIIGFFAQKRGKIGVAWFAITLMLCLASGFFLNHVITSEPRWILDAEYQERTSTPGYDLAFALITAGFALVVCAISVWSLPRSQKVSALAEKPVSSIASELERLAKLLEDGTISRQDFEAAKAKILA